ncbi:hypothetical protein B0H13DRAFT_2344396 [Mycena leptocephala]|nr:hypothetical protein B0H13DRAFT_2344396 [Mycena leptocephala]
MPTVPLEKTCLIGMFDIRLFCAHAEDGLWDGKAVFSESLQWESLVGVLRGRVELSVHCYEAVDLTQLIGLSNEFRLSIASRAIYPVPAEEILAASSFLSSPFLALLHGNIPAIALFASNARYAFYSRLLSSYEDDSRSLITD